MFSEKNHTSTSSGFAAGTLGIVQASGHAAGITASPVHGKAPNAPGQSKNTEKTQLVRRLPKARRFFRSRNIRKPPKPSPMQGKVAKAIFRENCFRRMRSNTPYPPRHPAAPTHRTPPTVLPSHKKICLFSRRGLTNEGKSGIIYLADCVGYHDSDLLV